MGVSACAVRPAQLLASRNHGFSPGPVLGTTPRACPGGARLDLRCVFDLEPHAPLAPRAGVTMKLVLHIGTGKTGSSAVQEFLGTNGELLAALGYHYARPTSTI